MKGAQRTKRLKGFKREFDRAKSSSSGSSSESHWYTGSLKRTCRTNEGDSRLSTRTRRSVSTNLNLARPDCLLIHYNRAYRQYRLVPILYPLTNTAEPAHFFDVQTTRSDRLAYGSKSGIRHWLQKCRGRSNTTHEYVRVLLDIPTVPHRLTSFFIDCSFFKE